MLSIQIMMAVIDILKQIVTRAGSHTAFLHHLKRASLKEQSTYFKENTENFDHYYMHVLIKEDVNSHRHVCTTGWSCCSVLSIVQ